MSLTHNICFVIIVITHSGSLDDPERDLTKYETLKDDNRLSDTDLNKKINETNKDDLVPINPDERNGPGTFHWDHGIVPYSIDPKSYDDIIIRRVKLAMNSIESVSCVKFRELPFIPEEGGSLDYNWLHIRNTNNERECVHTTMLGPGGKAVLTLGYDCMQQRDIIHALMHVLGFKDEVTHPQRDMYIKIMWSNIQPKYRPLFQISTVETPHKTLVEYDTSSVMHFHDRAYTVNGQATITPLIPGLLINPSDKLSPLDVMKLRLAFGHECNKRKVSRLYETCQNAFKGRTKESGERSSEDLSGILITLQPAESDKDGSVADPEIVSGGG